MSAKPNSRWLSWLLIAGGSCLLFLGAREWVASHVGQSEAEREFERTLPPPSPSKKQLPNSVASRAPLPAPRLGDSFAKLVIPRLDASLYVVEGVGDRELRMGPGHMQGTAMPGEKGNCIIAGHRDTHFRVLKDIRKGDDILLETSRGFYLYRVRNTEIVSPDAHKPLADTPDPRLNLITCYPFYYVGHAPKRFIVEAELAGTLYNPVPAS